MRTNLLSTAFLAGIALVSVTLTTAARPEALSWKQLVLDAHPVAYWRLGEKSGTTAHDAVGHHNGKYINKPHLGLPGAIPLDKDTAIGLDGPKTKSYVEVPSNAAFSVPTSGKGMTVEVWLRVPAQLDFPGQGDPKGGQAPYVHWLGKGESGHSEWALRFYSSKSKTRPNRISAYIFSPKSPKGSKSNEGSGAYFQDKLKPNDWIHVVATYDPPSKKDARVQIYRNGQPSPHNSSSGTLYKTFQVVPKAGKSPLRLGTLDLNSFLTGGLDEVAIYPRLLTPQEIAQHYKVGRLTK